MVNRDKLDSWNTDIAKSVDFYNQWFMQFAPKAFRETRIETTKRVKQALTHTANLTNIKPEVLQENPSILSILRMSTCPPIARDRLIGLAGLTKSLVENMEDKNRVSPRMDSSELKSQLQKISNIIEKMADPDIFVWKERGDFGSELEVYRASTIVADRLCGAVANPIIRNAQEKRQLASIKNWLEKRGYRELIINEAKDWLSLPAGTFSFRFNVPVKKSNGFNVNIPVDAVIKPKNSSPNDFPILLEAKSAGDYTNTNKRRKEEATKIRQLKYTYGKKVTFDLFLCGYFDSSFLGYEGAEGIDWVWEHRIDDLALLGL